MGRTVRLEAPRTVALVEEQESALGPGEVRIRTKYSGISAGTELSFYRGTNPYLAKRWDTDRRLFVPTSGDREGGPVPQMPGAGGLGNPGSISYPVDGLGYEEMGSVVELGAGVEGVEVGDLIWGSWGHRESVVRPASYASARKLDENALAITGIFSQIGAIALNAVLDANIHLGEMVAVFGLGVPGQLVAQLARLNGGRVVAVDRIDHRLELAGHLGAWKVVDAREGGVAERIREMSEGRGADVCLEISGAYPALHEAIRSAAYSARVVTAGFFQGEGAGLFLGEEFHHNRVQMVCSQIFGVAPSLTYRWNVERLQRTFMRLALTEQVRLEPLVSRVVPVEEADKAYDLVDRYPDQVLQVVLTFGDERASR